jgi:hypothetical protein
MRSRLFRLCVTAVTVSGFLSLAPRASADTINLDFNAGANGNGLSGGGPFHWTQTTPVNSNYSTTITTYCIGIQDTINTGGLNRYTVTSDLGQAPTIAAAPTPNAVSQINALYDHFYTQSFLNQTLETAFQLALWDLVYGSTNPLVLDRPTNATVDAVAAAMLNPSSALYAGTGGDLTGYHIVALVDASGLPLGTPGRLQDQLLVVPTPPVAGVPAPPGALLAGVGALALLGRARLSRRATA